MQQSVSSVGMHAMQRTENPNLYDFAKILLIKHYNCSWPHLQSVFGFSPTVLWTLCSLGCQGAYLTVGQPNRGRLADHHARVSEGQCGIPCHAGRGRRP